MKTLLALLALAISLNTMTILHDGPNTYRFPGLKKALGKYKDVPGELIRRRLQYLNGNS